MEPSRVSPQAPCLLFSFSFSILPHSLSQCSPQYFSLGLLHTDGKLCVYFKNHFATLHIPALPRSCCRATLTGMLLSGAGTRGCRQPTRPLETIVSLVPVPITAIWRVQGLQRLEPTSFFSQFFLLYKVILSMVTPWLHKQFRCLPEDWQPNLGNPELLKHSIQQPPSRGVKIKIKIWLYYSNDVQGEWGSFTFTAH